MDQGEIVIYKTFDSAEFQIEVRVEDETVWLTQSQMVELFSSTKQNISLHINNVFKEGELNSYSTVKEYLTVQIEGKRQVQRNITIYNLDVIISVGYRVKSQRGTQFRIWANKVLKNFLLKGYAIHAQFDQIEKKFQQHDKILHDHNQKFDLIINTGLKPTEGIFFDGQIFDAYQFVSDIIKSATKSIFLIYIHKELVHIASVRKFRTLQLA